MKHHTEQIYKGEFVIIDITAKPNHYREPCYNITATRPNGEVIESMFSCSHELSISVYNGMCDRYKDKEPRKPIIEKRLPDKYAKLRDDLKTALEIGKQAQTGEDGGTCNFDSPAISLPRWREELVKRAAEEAGSGAFKWSFGRGYFVFHPDTDAQGNDRTRNAEAMTNYLKTCGYDTFCYSQMD